MLKDVFHMGTIKSLDYCKVITALMCDIQLLHSKVFTSAALRLTLEKVESRCVSEGLSFLTKTLPRLGKALDKALAMVEPLDSCQCGFESMPDSKLPMFMGELFQQVLSSNGEVLPDADVASVRSLRQICYMFYKLELPYDTALEQDVIDRFIKTEDELKPMSYLFGRMALQIASVGPACYDRIRPIWLAKTIRTARKRLARVFSDFDPRNVYPKHGPGSVSTRERLWDKYNWTNISARITDFYPLDEFFYSSAGAVCDLYPGMPRISDRDLPARVVLVPKDSRGPRLISCEPLDFQWIQQGLSSAIYRHVESPPQKELWKTQRETAKVKQNLYESVRFTDQDPNRHSARYGSYSGRYATLDLNEASDRVSLGLVRLLFPEPLLTALEACRSVGTRLPNGHNIELTKYAPMGSALCFPVLALTIWALMSAMMEVLDAKGKSNRTFYVYGDDVIVPTEWSENAMIMLESFGLKINRDKSCTKGLFRESCGMDAFKGHSVTPVRIRTPWSPLRRPDVFASWVSYENSLYEHQYYTCSNLIADWVKDLYGPMPDKRAGLTCPSLYSVSERDVPIRTRSSKRFQRLEYFVWEVRPVKITRAINPWSMLLRFFAECNAKYETTRLTETEGGRRPPPELPYEAFRVREYTCCGRMKMQRQWR